MLSDQIKDKIDILLASETKIDDSFPIGNVLIKRLSTPYRFEIQMAVDLCYLSEKIFLQT